jgi:ornithine carbamoyltransferase
VDVLIACPPELEPDTAVVSNAEDIGRWTGASLLVLHDPVAAVMGADAVYTDVWASMGDEREEEERKRLLRRYQVNDALMDYARPDAIFLHCLPAKRGQEVAPGVIDGPRSAVWRQSANRLVTEQALLLALTRGVEHENEEV